MTMMQHFARVYASRYFSIEHYAGMSDTAVTLLEKDWSVDAA
jgi:hypothetical protein